MGKTLSVVCIVVILCACTSSIGSVSMRPTVQPLPPSPKHSSPKLPGKTAIPIPSQLEQKGLGISSTSYFAQKLKEQLLRGNSQIIDENNQILEKSSIKTLEDLVGKTIIDNGHKLSFKIEDGGLVEIIPSSQGGGAKRSIIYLQEHSFYEASMLSAGFYNGKELLVKDLPSGTAKYRGNAVGKKSDNSGFIKGTFELRVDFSRSKITGGNIKILSGASSANNRIITLKEGIIDSSNLEQQAKYSGEALEESESGRYEGRFFGNNAAETASKVEFANMPNIMKDVSFGGKKQL